MKQIICTILFTISIILLSCTKDERSIDTTSVDQVAPDDSLKYEEVGYSPLAPASSRTILIDASKDGGVWWFPQSPVSGYDPRAHHQGKALADYLRSLGYQVEELPRGVTITWDLLKPYSKVIRAAPYFPYQAAERAAYDSFLNRSASSLLLFQDHLANTRNDIISQRLGLPFEGSMNSTVKVVPGYAVTSGTSTLNYIAGSVIRSPGSHIRPLGHLTAGGESFVTMGLVEHPHARIFFIGDMNGLQQMPQPFTENLVKWLFQ